MTTVAARIRWLSIAGLSTMPGGIFKAFESARVEPRGTLAVCITSATITNSALMALYIWRFGKLPNNEVRSPKLAMRNAARPEYLPSPRRSQFTAIVWKQIRESGPIALAGVAGCVGFTMLAVLSSLDELPSVPTNVIGEAYFTSAAFVGCLVALVAGIGVCLNDMNPRVNEFWRSRPIQPDAWFWIRFVTGLLVVLASIYGPIALLAVFRFPMLRTWNPSEAYLLPAMQVAVFAAAVATTCLVRQAVYAAILSNAVVYVSVLLGLFLYLLPKLLQLGSLRPCLPTQRTSKSPWP